MSERIAMDDAESGGGGILVQLPAILWQRRWFIIVPFIVGTVGALLSLFLIPTIYRSSATMLVQSPQLPGKVTGDGSEEIISRRMSKIKEQLISRPDLIALIEQHSLYTDERKSKPLSKVIDKMRDAITLTPTEATGSANNPYEDKVIAFQLSYDYKDPAPAQAVAQALMERVLDLDSRNSAEQATNTVQFLTDQASGLQKQIGEIEGQMAAINARNGSALAGGTVIASNSGSYDVQIAALQRENSQLNSQRDQARTSNNRDPVVLAAESQLAAARAVYAEEHPDVVFAKQRLAEARELAKSNQAKMPLDSIDQQIAFNNQQLAALRSARAQEQSQTAAAMSAQARGPLVQQQLTQLGAQLERLNGQLKETSDRLLAARAGVKAEDQQMGERLAVVDPPVVPDTPFWPNRWLLMGAGVGGGLALGILLALAIELMMRPIRSPDAITAVTGAAPLVVIPMIKPRVPRRSFWQRLAFWKRQGATV